jgi:hypothetical protein
VSAWRELRGTALYFVALRGFLRRPLTEEEALERIRRRHEGRVEGFRRILAEAVFGNASSPYRALFAHAGIERGDVDGLVREHGLEAALERLYDEGVRVTIDELRARVPIRRGSLELSPGFEDFDNPLASSTDFVGRSGGSRSGGVPIRFNLALLEHDACLRAAFRAAFDGGSRPTAVWYPVPPGIVGLKRLLEYGRLGRDIERWFSQTDPGWRRGSRRYAAYTRATLTASRVHGRRFPAPEHTPADAVARVARWAADTKRQGLAGWIYTRPGGAARVCLAAHELGLDISGTFFGLGGEPYTGGAAQLVADAGCRAAANYSLGEVGGIAGIACAAPEAIDEVHVATDKVAVVQREQRMGTTAVGGLVYTALVPWAPKVAINLESDDFGVLSRRECGCPIERAGLGLSLHLHGIRSRLKLTTEGMHFLGEDVIQLVEEELPRRLGGSATDYQLVEQNENGLSKIAVVVSPRVGDLDDARVVEAVMSFLRSHGHPHMADVWTESTTLRVVRREPYATSDAKLPIVHVLDNQAP